MPRNEAPQKRGVNEIAKVGDLSPASPQFAIVVRNQLETTDITATHIDAQESERYLQTKNAPNSLRRLYLKNLFNPINRGSDFIQIQPLLLLPPGSFFSSCLQYRLLK